MKRCHDLTISELNLHLHVEADPDVPHPETKVYDSGDFMLRVGGAGWADSQLIQIVGVHRRARHQGIEEGKTQFKYDLLRMLGAEPRKPSEG